MLWLDLGEYRGPSRFHAFVMYALERRKQRMQELSYRIYVTDSLRMAPQGQYMSRRYADVIKPRQEIDADAIIEHVLAAACTEEP